MIHGGIRSGFSGYIRLPSRLKRTSYFPNQYSHPRNMTNRIPPIVMQEMTFAWCHFSVEPHERPMRTRIAPVVKNAAAIQSTRASFTTKYDRSETRQPGSELRGSGRGPSNWWRIVIKAKIEPARAI